MPNSRPTQGRNRFLIMVASETIGGVMHGRITENPRQGAYVEWCPSRLALGESAEGLT